jgi:geranylgeranyl pyrophosphate synthase/predicted secreted hydrolase
MLEQVVDCPEDVLEVAPKCAEAPRPGFAPPSDWPGPGPIDLAVHDLPHASAGMEWWYVNAHLHTEDGGEFSLFASFFRVKVGKDEKTGRPCYTHFLTWGLTDVRARKYHATTLLDPASPQIAVRRIDDGKADEDPRVCRALREVFARGRVPLPDQLLKWPGKVALHRLALDLDGNRFGKDEAGRYTLDLWDEGMKVGCRLTFSPRKPAVRHGDDGVTLLDSRREMFYYFIPRCDVAGVIHAGGTALAVESGSGWYDHEFGDAGEAERSGPLDDFSWNWLSAQLDDGTDLSVFEIVPDGAHAHERHAVLIAPDGGRRLFTRVTLEPLATWTSSRTFQSYPVRWRVRVPEADVELTVEAELPGQELITVLAPPAFWEGRIKVSGRVGSRTVRGPGFFERTGFREIRRLEDFFAAVGQETRRALQALLPLSPTAEEARDLIASEERAHYLDGVDLGLYSRSVLRPIREVADRGGKAWRSFAALACVDLVGGDPEEFRYLLAVPELLHVGSLIVDDVEDRSGVRRGGPACHVVHGEPLAINAGSACYFFAQLPVLQAGLPAAKAVRLYEAYFEAMRSAHAGQALDLAGLGSFAAEAVETGEGELLERRVLATHRLKSAAPPAMVARVAALLGDGTAEQARCLEELFEAYGLAFQIVDDVLNLRGFAGGLKSRGEDVTEGKVTAPVAKALALLGRPERRALWDVIASKPSDPEVIAGVIATIEGCGALDACERQARELIEGAWRRVDAVFPDSHAKVNLRAFSWFILERHY